MTPFFEGEHRMSIGEDRTIGKGPWKMKVVILTDDIAVASPVYEDGKLFVGKAERSRKGYSEGWEFKGVPRTETTRVEVQKESISSRARRAPQIVWRKK